MDKREERRTVRRGCRIPGIDGWDVECDLYGLESRKKDRTAVVFVHGGGFCGGDKDQFLAAASYLALSAGALCITVQYRTAGRKPYPAPVVDLFSVFRWLEQERETLGICLSNTCLVGGSPGANIAAMAMLAGKLWKERCGIRTDIFQPANGILLNGIYDMEEFYDQNPQERAKLDRYLGWIGTYPDSKTRERLLRECSPVRMMRPGCRFLLLHGEKDQVIPPRACIAMEAAMRRQGSQADTVMFPGEGHGWFNRPEKMYQVIRQMERFIDQIEGRCLEISEDSVSGMGISAEGRKTDGIGKTERVI